MLSLSNLEALNLLCFVNKDLCHAAIRSYADACSQFEIRNLATEQEFENYQTQLMRRYKQSE